MKRYDACTALSLFGMALFLPDAASYRVSKAAGHADL